MKNSIKKLLIGIASTMLIGCSVNDGNSSNKQSSDSNSSETLSSDSSFNTPSSEEITSESSSPYSPSSSETFHSSSQEDADDEDTYWVSDTYPYYSSPSVRFALSLEGGWNLGNSLDAHTDKVDSTHDYFDYQSLVASGRNEWETETCYGNPKVNLSLLQKVKEAGFTTIRIPVSWHQHCTISNNYKITEYWMNRVKTIVDQALGLGFKVILNTHHDIDPHFIYPDYNHINNSIKYIESIWEQISNVFGDYDKDKLVYEGCNEPRLTKNDDDFNTDLNTYEVADCINRINQTFVNKIRSSSKPNEQKRYLMVKGYADSWFPITQQNDYFKIPNDPINHILISTHLYYPSEFCFLVLVALIPHMEANTKIT